MKKLYLIIAMLMIGVLGYTISAQASTATTITIPLDITNILPGVQNYTNPVIFKYGGNSFGGLFIFRHPQELINHEDVILGGDSTTCRYKIRGFYYNNQRGARRRPLDEESLTILQDIDPSYNNLTLDGGLFYSCMNNQSGYGQITHTRSGSEYKLIAGVDIQTGTNSYNPNLSLGGRLPNGYTSFTMRNRSAGGYIYDSAGGIAEVCGLRIALDMPASTGGFNPYSSNHCGSTHMSVLGDSNLTGSVGTGGIYNFDFHITTIIGSGGLFYYSGSESITIQGGTRDGTFTAPTSTTLQDNSQGLPPDAIFLQTIEVGATGGVGLYADADNPFWLSIHVPNGTVGQWIDIYRSQDGINRYLNTPQNGCQLDANKYCTFQTDHLSFFSFSQKQNKNEDTILTEKEVNKDKNSISVSKDTCPKEDLSGNLYDNTCKRPNLNIIKLKEKKEKTKAGDMTYDTTVLSYQIGDEKYEIRIPTVDNKKMRGLVARLHEAVEESILPQLHTQEKEFIKAYNMTLQAIKINADNRSISISYRKILLQKSTTRLISVLQDILSQ